MWSLEMSVRSALETGERGHVLTVFCLIFLCRVSSPGPLSSKFSSPRGMNVCLFASDLSAATSFRSV